MSRKSIVGREVPLAAELHETLQDVQKSGYDFICVHLSHPRLRRQLYRSRSSHALAGQIPFTRADLVLNSRDWGSLVVGRLSPYLNVDSSDSGIRRNHELMLEQELNFAAHLSLPAVTFRLKSLDCVNFARMLLSKIQTPNTNYSVWVEVPMREPVENPLYRKHEEEDDPDEEDEGTESASEDDAFTWQRWSRFRNLIGPHGKLGLALEITSDLPSPEAINRWLGEPIRCVFVSTKVFLTNQKGFPVLSQAHQALIRRLLCLDAQVIIRGFGRHSHLRFYQQYITYLWQTRPPEDALAQFAKGYEDYLQSPLAPLSDNLESATYETFEKDPTKYSLYQEAIRKVLHEKYKGDHKPLLVLVVGAGRGPLVRAALNASKIAKCPIRVFAVEKNPNAVVTLQHLQRHEWKEQVEVIPGDMRYWKPPQPADLVVSELLGSFGDNELSPECLDPLNDCLKDDGVSIPSSYTSHLAPISSYRVYSEVKVARIDTNERVNHDRSQPPSQFHTPYVVHLRNYVSLAAPLPLFSFEHPNRAAEIDNSRYEKLEFEMKEAGMLHGFAGYFHSVLYKDVHMSIVPETHSPGMFSWFPIFFPIKEPVAVGKGDKLEVHFWRVVGARHVWYEWTVTDPVTLQIHNAYGHSYAIPR